MTIGLSDDNWRDLTLSLRTHRRKRRLSPLATARLIDQALAFSSVEQLAERLGLEGGTTLRRIHRLLRLPDDVAALVEWGERRGTLSMSTASELARLPDAALIREAFFAVLEHNLTRQEAVQLVQSRLRSGQDIAECLRRTLLTRPRVVRSALIMGSLLSHDARQYSATIGDADAERKLRNALAQFCPDVVPKAVRVSSGRFSLLLSEEDSIRLRSRAPDGSIEALVTRLLDDDANRSHDI